MPKVYIIATIGNQYEEMYVSNGWELTTSITEADLVQFTGGSDVSPSLYGQEKHPETHPHAGRDLEEQDTYQHCIELGKPMVGICRGAQFLNVLCGGSLWQHVTGHAIWNGHLAIDRFTGEAPHVSSTHHQMMKVGEQGYATMFSLDSLSRVREYMDGAEVGLEYGGEEVEACFYEEQKVYCFQPHPEYGGYKDCTKYFFSQVHKYLGLQA